MIFSMIKTLALMAGILLFASNYASAAGEYENDDFYLGFGSSNIEVKGGDLISGENYFGGVGIGLFWNLFFDFGYGAVTYSETTDVGGSTKDIDFRTTGGHYGIGFILPIHNMRLGGKYHVNPNNRWSEEVSEQSSGVVISRISGKISYNTYKIFARFGDSGVYEIGVRRDQINETNSILTNSFGPYFVYNIGLD